MTMIWSVLLNQPTAPTTALEHIFPKWLTIPFLLLTLVMFLFWSSWTSQPPLTRSITLYFSTDCNTHMVYLKLCCLGFVPTSQIGHNRLLSTTAAHKSQPFPVHVVFHRALYWARFCSSSTQNLFLTACGLTPFSLSPLQMTLNSMTLLLHWTLKRPYLPCKPAFLMPSPRC